jgi:DUF4097 and DUF4098 domain-containing protein YvlB
MAVFLLFVQNPTMMQLVASRRRKMLYFIVWNLCMTLLSSCASEPALLPIPEQIHSLPEGHSLAIDLEGIQLELIGHEESSFSISGTTPINDIDLQVRDIEQEQLTQISTGSSELLLTQITVKVPFGSRVRVVQGTGSVYVQDFVGDLTIRTISAPIQVDRLEGYLHANSRRGSIEISDSRGEIDALAEADDIRFRDVKGSITGTNILGEISFHGEINIDDTTRLETDHGAVNVGLHPGSDVEIEITSAGGRIVCTLPGMSGTFDRCQGILDSGAGALWIRTVSGSIFLEQSG